VRFEVATAFFEVSSKPDKMQAIVLPHINLLIASYFPVLGSKHPESFMLQRQTSLKK